MVNKAANAGVDALLGFEFQRNCALYLLLSDYDNFKDSEFFLCIEHHDDFLFCYRTPCCTQIEQIHSYQAKKLTGSVWTINKRFSEIVTKILEVGANLINDPAPKCQSYKHELTFISNSDIKLQYSPKKAEKAAGKTEVTYLLNEQNNRSNYDEIPEDIKTKIDKQVSDYCTKEKLTYHKNELDNFFIQWIDFPRNKDSQRYLLIGLMDKKFPHVSDSTAAVDLLLTLFRQVEAIYNQKKIIQLLDATKRVEGSEIKKAIDVIETNQKTFELWRNHASALASKFRIPLGIQNQYETYIKNTFELLKDMANHEYQIIRSYVSCNDYIMSHFNYEDMFEQYMSDIKIKNNINVNDIDLLFAILCSYVEYHGENIK